MNTQSWKNFVRFISISVFLSHWVEVVGARLEKGDVMCFIHQSGLGSIWYRQLSGCLHMLPGDCESNQQNRWVLSVKLWIHNICRCFPPLFFSFYLIDKDWVIETEFSWALKNSKQVLNQHRQRNHCSIKMKWTFTEWKRGSDTRYSFIHSFEE